MQEAKKRGKKLEVFLCDRQQRQQEVLGLPRSTRFGFLVSGGGGMGVTHRSRHHDSTMAKGDGKGSEPEPPSPLFFPRKQRVISLLDDAVGRMMIGQNCD